MDFLVDRANSNGDEGAGDVSTAAVGEAKEPRRVRSVFERRGQKYGMHHMQCQGPLRNPADR
jgi:hypothetical protein